VFVVRVVHGRRFKQDSCAWRSNGGRVCRCLPIGGNRICCFSGFFFFFSPIQNQSISIQSNTLREFVAVPPNDALNDRSETPHRRRPLRRRKIRRPLIRRTGSSWIYLRLECVCACVYVCVYTVSICTHTHT